MEPFFGTLWRRVGEFVYSIVRVMVRRGRTKLSVAMVDPVDTTRLFFEAGFGKEAHRRWADPTFNEILANVKLPGF